MRILHTSDWHLGKKLDNFNRHEEQQAVLEEIIEIVDNEQVDAIIIAGDLYDTYNPPIESVELFYKTLKRLSKNGKRPVIAIAGNHDSPDRIEAPDPLARESGIILVGYPNTKIRKFKNEAGLEVLNSDDGFLELQIPGTQVPLRIILNPYANQFRMKTFLGVEDEEEELRNILQDSWTRLSNQYCDSKGVNILISHMFFVKEGAVIPDEPDDEKPILHVGGVQTVYPKNIPDNIQYVALGHLHRKQTVSNQPCPVIYSGSPISYSFSEANQTKYVCIVDIEPGTVAKVKDIVLTKGRKLERKKFDNIDEAVLWLENNQESLVELTMVSDDFLTAGERKRLKNAHEHIITIIPEVKSAMGKQEKSNQVDISKNMDELFVDYFKHKQGQSPNEELLDLFKEVISK
ncbi:MAG: exonuclease subunit SbcD [Bacteroidota bacterium]